MTNLEGNVDAILTVFFGIMSADLNYGWEEDVVYDEHASAVKYAEMCSAAIIEYYDGQATVEYKIEAGISGAEPYSLQTRVDGETDCAGVLDVNEVMSQVYQSFGWIVYDDARAL